MIAVAGNIAVIADTYYLRVVDVSVPSSPVIVGNIGGFPFVGTVLDVKIQGDYAFAPGNLFRVFDISNPAAPSLVGSAELPGGVGDHVAVTGPYRLCGQQPVSVSRSWTFRARHLQ